MLKKNASTLFLLPMCWGLLAGCGGEGPQDSLSAQDAAADSSAELRMRKTKAIFYNVPSPMETSAMLKAAGAQYDKRILNDVLNVDKYTSASQQALNLGIYGGDLSYATVFEQTQESMFYTSCVKKLSDKLGLSQVFSDSVISELEGAMNDRDALLDIITQTYWNMDGYLKESDRASLSALIMLGGWVEGLFVATHVAGPTPTDELRQRISEQQLSLNDLLALLGTYPSEPLLESAMADLRSLQPLFPSTTQSATETKVTQENGVAVIGGGAASPPAITDEQLKALRDRVATIRQSYIN
jgi:hypothetical protein